MKKIFMLATAAFLISGATFATENGKKKNKTKKASCSKAKSCCKDKSKTATI